MTNDNEMIMACELAADFTEMALEKIKDKNADETFRIVMMTCSSFVATFIDAIARKDQPDAKHKLLHEVFNYASHLLDVKEISRNSN